MAKKETSEKSKSELRRLKKMVKVTVELPESFIRLLGAKANLSDWPRWHPKAFKAGKAPQMDAASVLAWIVVLEARGELPDVIDASIPPMWADEDGPKLDHSERKVYEIQPDGTPRYIGGGA